MTFRPNRLTIALLAASLLFSAAACSSDDGEESPETDTTEQVQSPEPDSDEQGAEDGSTTVGTMPDGDASRPFGVNAEALAEAISTATRADDFEIDGNSFRLIYNEGEVDGTTAFINCTVVNELKGDDDTITLVYPDGELNCEDNE